MLQGIVGIEVIEPGGIDDAEEEVAQFARRAVLVAFVELHLELAQLFAHLIPYVFLLFPVEANVAGLILNAVSLDERGQRFRHAAQHSLVAMLFLLLDLLPGNFHIGCFTLPCL